MGFPEAILFIFCLAAFIGTILPVLPSSPLVVIGALVHGLLTDFAALDTGFILLLILMSGAAEVSEFLLSAAGAKKFGSGRRGIAGAVLGTVLGLILLGPVGLIIGPLGGAFILELTSGRHPDKAAKAAAGAVFGLLGGKVLKGLIVLVMVYMMFSRLN